MKVVKAFCLDHRASENTPKIWLNYAFIISALAIDKKGEGRE